MTASVTNATGTGATTPSSGLGIDFGEQKEMFLSLLVAQLKNQDPTSPMDQKDMMAQMAQFSTVEQLANVSSTLESLQSNATFGHAVSLIGKTVDYLDSADNIVHDATVSAVTTAGGVTRLVLGDGQSCGVNDVVMVK